jgi:hypothetical protein
MIASAMKFDNPIPTKVSRWRPFTLMWCSLEYLARREGPDVLGLLDACQKNRYGLIVVPSTATTVVR